MNEGDNNTIFFEKDKDHRKQIEYKFTPSDSLKSYIKEYMILECTNSIILETLPSTSFSLNYILKGSILLTQEDGSQIDLPKTVSFGITRRFFHFTFSDFVTLFVVIFNPGFASTITEKPLNEFFEKFIPMNEFFDYKTNRSILQQLQKQQSHKNMIAIIETFLIDKIILRDRDTIIYDSISKIKKEKGLVSIKDIISELPISRDTFEKRFRQQVGTTPKRYASIIRFRNLFEQSFENESLTNIALNAGYYDQSHFIKDFKASTGKLPSDCL